MPSSSSNRPPSVEIIVSDSRLAELVEAHGRPVITGLVRTELDHLREQLQGGMAWPDVGTICAAVRRRAEQAQRRFPQRVINATGVLLHTNLGRAPWDERLIDAIRPRLASYLSLEYDLESGTRGKRARALESALADLTGSEAALVVNNNAAAVYLVLSALAWNREVIISRGELVQIGGGFRIPEILARSGAILREVGTTNRTDTADYAKVCGPQTALILKVHRSNFTQSGFVSEASARDLAALGHERGVPVVWDVGSGAVGPCSVCRYSGEPTLRATISSGVDLVTASGDKLLGGPQAGIIAGRRPLIDRLRSDPFYRALRPDKAGLLALEVTVAAHRAGRAEEVIPLYRMLATPSEVLRERAERLALAATGNGWNAAVVPVDDTFGGGAAPEKTVSGWAVRLAGEMPAHVLADRARTFDPPIIGTVADDAFVLSVRTIAAEDDKLVIAFLQS